MYTWRLKERATERETNERETEKENVRINGAGQAVNKTMWPLNSLFVHHRAVKHRMEL